MGNNNSTDFDTIIGTGSGLINPNSEDFRLLQEAIKNHSSQISKEEKRSLRIKGVIYRMKSFLNEFRPSEIVSTGAFLKELVEVIGVPHKDFASYIGYKNSNLSALYSGTRRINHDLALKLGNIFNMDPTIWLNLQNKVELLEINEQDEEEYKKYQLNDLLRKVG